MSNRGPSAYQPNALPLGQTGSPGLESVLRLAFQSDALPTEPFSLPPNTPMEPMSTLALICNLRKCHRQMSRVGMGSGVTVRRF